MLRGQPRFFSPFRGWCPISAGDDWAADVLSAAYLFQPAGVLEHLVKDGTKGSLRLPHIPKLNRLIVSQLGFEVESVIMLGRADVWGVVEKVRNLVLDWAMELESAGVLGEGMSFTINEKSRATTVTNNYFAQNIGVAGDVDGQSSVQSNQIASGATIDPVAVQDFLQQLRQLTPMLPKNSREAVEPQVRDLETELRQRRPDGHKLHKLLASIRAVCEGAGGNLIAAGIIEGIKAMFSSGGS